MFKGIGRKAQKIWRSKSKRFRDEEPLVDIQRDNIDEAESAEEENSFRFSSVLDHIKKNWADGHSLNKKF